MVNIMKLTTLMLFLLIGLGFQAHAADVLIGAPTPVARTISNNAHVQMPYWLT